MNQRQPGGGYKHEPGYGRISDGKIYIGIVKSNKDAMKMGRLEVWIPEMGGSPDDPNKWHIVSYASPFAGATDVDDNIEDSQTMNGSQRSYGWWMVPPDLGNQVLCCFVNGEATKGYWFACLWQQNMNHMVPGIASNASYQEGEQGIMPPVVEYNKDQSSADNLDPQAPKRPRFDPLHEGLTKQGLYTDFDRGPSSASARRDMPSKVYGLLTPRANQLYVDDDPENEYIRLRTRSGVQVLIHETNGFVYINSGNGDSWVEISDVGIDIYTKNSVSMRAELDFNIRADRDVNIDAGRNVNINAQEHIKMRAGLDLNGHSGQEIRFTAGTNMHLVAATNMFSSAGSKMGQKASTHHTQASTIMRDGTTHDNGGKANVPQPTLARQPTFVTQIDHGGKTKDTPVSRMPHHEPWAGHPKSRESTIPRGDLHAVPVDGRGNQGASMSDKNNKSSVPPTKEQKTGEGSKSYVPYDPSKNTGKVQSGRRDVPMDIEAAIAHASSLIGVDYGYMMAMAEQESGFRPTIKAPTSSAYGLYQFIDGTWAGMVKKYGKQYDITMADRSDPRAQAIMAALYTKENKVIIERATGHPASNTDLYMGHFLGGGGAAKFLSSPADTPAWQAAGTAAANANRNVFYVKGDYSQPRTVAEVKQFFGNKIEPKSASYSANPPTRA